MNITKLKKISSIILILVGVITLVIELVSGGKKYYLQSIGVLCLMIGLFMVNSRLTSRSENIEIEMPEEEEKL